MWDVRCAADDSLSGVLLDANIGGDAGTAADVARQLAGALYGASGIPPGLLARFPG